jgi:anti-sigma regulatory factor (Ser/Thr protein kinase)
MSAGLESSSCRAYSAAAALLSLMVFVERVLAGGFSTARSLGLGVSGSRRLVDEFTIESTVGRGTTVTFVKWTPY